jgi:phosphotransferase system HPr-like phosphotransfer protein
MPQQDVMAVLKLDVRQGDTVTLRTAGEGADEALEALADLIESL